MAYQTSCASYTSGRVGLSSATAVVADAAGRLAAEAESYGFRVLGRMARCVESAGRAKDLQAVTDLLPELATAVERHRISLGS